MNLTPDIDLFDRPHIDLTVSVKLLCQIRVTQAPACGGWNGLQSQTIEVGEQCRSWTICSRTVYLYYIVYSIRNKLFQMSICMLIYANQETLQYFASKSVQFRIRHTPFILLLKTTADEQTLTAMSQKYIEDRR